MTAVGKVRIALATTIGVALGAPAAASAAAQHVDCSANPAGADGSIDHPWTALADVPSTLGPGDSILLKRGSACSGSLSVDGSGTAANRATVGAYGTGAPPEIAGNGADAVRLEDTSFTTVEDLALTNPGDGSAKKRGLHLIGSGQTVEGLVARGLLIRNVGGNLDKDGGGSGGIQVDAEGPGLGRFADLRISDNQISDVSRSGIFVVGTSQGGARPRSGQPWPEASTGVEISGNRVDRTAGDGIVVLGSDAAHVHDNVVSRGNLAGRGLADPQGLLCNAGIWAFNSNGTVIEHNEVFRMEFNGCDGTGFDVDYMQDGTVIQFNYSHDNEGGFLLLCTDSQPRASIVRFNLSVDDGFALNSSPCSEPTGSYSGIDIYNNTIVSPEAGFAFLGAPSQTLFGPPSLSFFNNLLVATSGAGPGFTCEPGCRSNLFWGLPAAGADPVVGDPRFVDGAARGSDAAPGFKLAAGSPAYGAAAPIPADATSDYFGQPIDRSRAPNIGFDQSAATPADDVGGLKKVRLVPHAFRAERGKGPSLVRRGGAARILLRAYTEGKVTLRISKRRRSNPLPGKLRARVEAGGNAIRFTGRLRGRALKPGRYTLEARFGADSDVKATGFRIKRPKKR